MKRRIAFVIGTRPEAIKLIPVYLQCSKSAIFQPLLISTGQHSGMLDQVLDYFSVEPDYFLKVLDKDSNLSTLTARLFQSLEMVIQDSVPDMIMVQGDTCSAWVSAMVGFYHKIPVAHVEAGLRTWNKYSPFPEEMYRTQISQLAEVHFTPTTAATKNLKESGTSRVYQVGNTVVDSLHYCLKREYNSQSILEQIGLGSNGSAIVLVTCHRRENIDQMAEIASAINSLSEQHPQLTFVLPLHMNPLVRVELGNNLKKAKNILLLEPIPYDQFVVLLSKCYLILTDSGGILPERCLQ